MNLALIVTLVLATACSTLGAIYFFAWITQRDRKDFLAFAVGAFSIAAFSGFELAAAKVDTPEQYIFLERWCHLPIFGIIVPLVWFVWLYTNAGRKWLLWTITILRTLVLVVNFSVPGNVNHSEITGITKISMWGETMSVPVGTASLWAPVAQVGLLLALAFCADATITMWRRGDRRIAVTIGGSTTLFFFLVVPISLLISYEILPIPHLVSIFFTFIMLAMGVQLSSDLRQSIELTNELRKTKIDLLEYGEQLQLSAEAGRVGVWSRDLEDHTIRANDEWYHLCGFDPSQPLTLTDILDRVHPHDRDRMESALTNAVETGGEYKTDYRVVLPNGETRCISARGKVYFVDGKPKMIRGTSVDITNLMMAEKAAHDLSGRMIGAQEAERKRIARELHDDLGQSLALLSIQLGLHNAENESNVVARDFLTDLSSQVRKIASDVHQISHDLHPSKLEQLGPEAAIRGFCREMAAAHNFQVEFEAVNIPRKLANDVALCLYRVTQESLQNIQKHSGATVANVNLSTNGENIDLRVTDNGCGFDIPGNATKESLGLISMRERVRSVAGTFAIESHPGSGTQIRVSVPAILIPPG